MSPPRPTVSALVVTHDSRAVVGRCLESLERARSAGAVAEVIVADGASTDGTRDFVAREHSGVRLLELPENRGFGAANNRAAEAATGDAFLLLNPDAWLEEGREAETVEALVDRLAADERLGAVAPRLTYPDGTLQFTWVPETSVPGEALQMLRNRFEGRPWAHGPAARLLGTVLPGFLSGACLLVPRRAWEAVGGFDEGIFLYFEDVDLCRRLRRRGFGLAVEGRARVRHVKGASKGSPGNGAGKGAPSTTDPSAVGAASIEYRRAQLYYYAKHRPAWEERLVRRRLARRAAAVEAAGDQARARALRSLLGDRP